MYQAGYDTFTICIANPSILILCIYTYHATFVDKLIVNLSVMIIRVDHPKLHRAHTCEQIIIHA